MVPFLMAPYSKKPPVRSPGVADHPTSGEQMKSSARNTLLFLAVFGAAVVAFLLVLDHRTQADNARVEGLRSSIEHRLTTALAVGANSEQIESVLTQQKLACTYSDVLKGYYSHVSTRVPDSRIDVVISVDDSRRMRSIQVRTFWTSL